MYIQIIARATMILLNKIFKWTWCRLTCCMVFIRLNDATYARYLLGGAWGVVRELVPKPNVLSPNPTPVQVVMPPLVGGGAWRNSLRLIGYNSNSGVGSPLVGEMTYSPNKQIISFLPKKANLLLILCKGLLCWKKFHVQHWCSTKMKHVKPNAFHLLTKKSS